MSKKEKSPLVVREPQPHKPQSRHRRGDLQRIYDAVIEEFSVPELQAMLRQTWEVAADKKDSGNMLRVLQFVMDYAVGKPVQRSISVGMDSDALLRFIKGETTDEGEIIEMIDVEQA